MNKQLLTIFLIFAASLFSVQSWGQCPDSTSNQYQRGDFGENNALHYEFASGCGGSTLTISGTGALNGLPPVGLTGQSNVIVEDGITSIGDSVFAGGWGSMVFLNFISIPNSVTSIGNYAFAGCQPYLTPIIIPSNLTSIGSFAFVNAYSRGGYDVYIPALNNLKSIGDFAFYDYGNHNTNIQPGVFNISSGVTSIGMGAFFNCPLINSINVASDNAYYSSEDGVLFNKDKTILLACLGSINGTYTIPNSVTSIGGTAFLSSSVTSITIPSSVKSISNYTVRLPLFPPGYAYSRVVGGAFGASGLKSIYVDWKVPIAVDSIVFAGVNKPNITLFVPYGTKSLYQADPVWGTFGTTIEQAPTSVVNINNSSFHAYITNNVLKVESSQAEKITVYSAKGVLLYTALKSAGENDIPVSVLRGSVYIIKGSVSGTIKVVR